MPTIDLPAFVGYVKAWGQARQNDFKFMWPVKGGWEGWIQVDLTAFILSKNNTVDILREQHIYTNARKAVDLLINASDDPAKQIAVELKAQSFENRNKFVYGENSVWTDVNKLTYERASAFEGITSMVLALPFEPEALKLLLALPGETNEEFRPPIFASIWQSTEIAVMGAVLKNGIWAPQGS